MVFLSLFIPGVIVVTTLLLIRSHLFKKKCEGVFNGRPDLSDDEFYNNYFSSLDVRKEVPIMVRKTLEEELGMKLPRLSANDSIAKELRFIYSFDSLIDLDWIMSIEEVFEIDFLQSETEKMETIHDIVMITEAKLKEKEAVTGFV